MRYLRSLLLAAALSPIAAMAQQAPTSTADQGKPNAGAPWFVQLYLGGAAVSLSNPFPVQVGNAFALDATVTARLGTLGQKTMAGSTPVVMASDFVPALAPNAATAANQASEIAALGTTGDGAYTGTGSASIVAALKGVYAALVAPTPAGSAVIGKVGIDQTVPGTTNGVVEASASQILARTPALGSAGRAASQPVTRATDDPPVPVQASVWWVEQLSYSIPANGIAGGPGRTSGTTQGNPGAYGYFQATVSATVAGTLTISNNSGGVVVASMTVAAGAPATLKTPALGAGFYSQFTAGGTAGTLTILSDGYTAN